MHFIYQKIVVIIFAISKGRKLCSLRFFVQKAQPGNEVQPDTYETWVLRSKGVMVLALT